MRSCVRRLHNKAIITIITHTIATSSYITLPSSVWDVTGLDRIGIA